MRGASRFGTLSDDIEVVTPLNPITHPYWLYVPRAKLIVPVKNA